MKKLIVGLLAAFLMATGLVAFSGTSATAACTYAACFTTTTKVGGPGSTTQGKKITLTVKVTARGNAKPKGKVTVKITGPGGYKQTVTKSSTSFKVATRKLTKAGKYKVAVTFKGGPGFRDSKATKSLTVKKKRRG